MAESYYSDMRADAKNNPVVLKSSDIHLTMINIPYEKHTNEIAFKFNQNCRQKNNEIITTTQLNTNKSEYAFTEFNIKQQKITLIAINKNTNDLLQSSHESDNQSGIAINIIIINKNNITNIMLMNKIQAKIINQIDSMRDHIMIMIEGNETSLKFSHKILIKNKDTVNMICDLIDYLIKINVNRNLNINKYNLIKINDQNLNDKNKNNKNNDEPSTTEIIEANYRIVRNNSKLYVKFEDLLKLIEKQKHMNFNCKPFSRLRLCGGGETSLNNGTSAWGSPPNAMNNPNIGSWGTTSQPPPSQQVWGNVQQNSSQRPPLDAVVNKPLPQQQQIPPQMSSANINGANTWNPASNQNKITMQQQPPPTTANVSNPQQQLPPPPVTGPPPPTPTGTAPTATTKNQLEHLNTMREALFSQDGWGCQHVNQDTKWDVPISPEPGKGEAPSMWKSNLVNGTDLWEANLRNGGQPPQQPTQKTPWGPSSNIGGTWGEDDDATDSGSVWTGPSNNPPAPTGQQTWNQNSGSGIWPPNTSGAVPSKKDNEWGPNGGSAGLNNWEVRSSQAPPTIPGPADMPNVDIRNIRSSGVIDPNREIRGDPRGISGRLNGNSGMWDQHSIPNVPINKLPPQTVLSNTGGNNQWPVSTQINPPANKLQSGWDDVSPPTVRRNNMGNVEDGATLWGQNTIGRQNSAPSNWKDLPENMARNSIVRNSIGAGNAQTGPTIPGPRLGPGPQVKPDNMWGHNVPVPARNNSWDEPPGNNWEDKVPGGISNIGSAWNDGPQNTTWNKNKPVVGGAWPDSVDGMNNDWNSHGSANINKPPNKLNPIDFIRNSKQFRMLCEMGYKKEDIELTLRTTNMSLDESLDILQRNNSSTLNDWRRHDDPPGGFEQQFPGRYPSGAGSSMPFPPNNQNMLNNIPSGNVGGGNPNMPTLNNLQPLQKFLSQAPPPTQSVPSFNQPPNGPGHNSSAQPSTQQLRMLVHQIQMAVQAGYLNHQILNQPLAPQTLFLLNQLLNNIKQLQLTQSNIARGGPGVNNVQIGMTISKFKTQIAALQSQIAQAQTIYVKQQQQQGNLNTNSHIGNDFLRNQNDLSAMQNNFSDMTMNKDHNGGGGGGGYTSGGGSTSQQSRLNQWKLPAIDKDIGNDLTDFSRAPGTTAKPTLSTSNSAMGSLGLQGDGTWSSGRTNVTDGWPDPSNDLTNKDWPNSQESSAFSDLVPEFEPGKPWKGTQMKIEDDPTITPGSLARSPLSLAGAKDSDLFAASSKASPTDSISLTSSTWSFNPSNNQQNNFTISKLGVGNNGKNSWTENIAPPIPTASELWGSPMNKAPRGPPPGLSSNKNSGINAPGMPSNGWIASNSQRVGPGTSWGPGGGTTAPVWFSTWLLLKNLTAQIDGSTLRTLCMQHGPLQNFHLYLTHGIALCKYSSREEASKAQQALNNCVLSNTTICAESPTENEVQTILQHLGVPGGNGNGNTNNNNSIGSHPWRPSTQQQPTRPTDTWGSSWPASNSGSNLWTPLDGPTERGTPSSLNSFLPENLLGGELN